ncbi:MAG: Hint domain-containing protein [Acetobacteraceae bacterium]
MPVVTDYTALLSGSYWNGIEVPELGGSAGNPVIVTFSFPTSLPAYDAAIPGFTADTLASFTAFSAAEQAQAITALNEWAAASGLIFVQVAPGQGDINFTNVDLNTSSYSGAGGIGFYPFGNWNFFSYPYFTGDLDSSGDIFMNSAFQNPDGTVAYGTLLHEIGHAIGLKHPTEIVNDAAAIPPVLHDQVLASNDPAQTIMATVGDENSPDGHLHQLDKDAAAFLYGPAGTGTVVTSATASGTNSVSQWIWDQTTQSVTQTAVTTSAVIRGTSVNDVIITLTGNNQIFGLAGDDTLNGNDGNDKLFGGTGVNSMYGGDGDDEYYVENSADAVFENSNEGYDQVFASVSFTLVENLEFLQVFGQGLTAHGNNEGNTIYGDGTYATTLIGGTGIDYIVGGAGNDQIAGGGNIDTLWGQGGADTFIFNSVNDAPTTGPYPTTIGDFDTTQDIINMSGILDSNGQPMHFIGTDSFNDEPGEVRYSADAFNDTLVEGDVDGDGATDFVIRLTGLRTLTSSNFVFSPFCFLAGTRIATPDGEQLVETLAPGDMVRTASGNDRRIVWIGRGRHRAHPGRRDAASPVLIRRGALADAVPDRDLRITRAHALFLDGMLVPAEYLVNHRTILWDGHTGRMDLYHIELESHDVLIANGAPAESYRDDGNRWLFQNGNTGWDLPPQLPCVPVVTGGPALDALWRRLLDRAGPDPDRGLTDDPDLHLVVDGVRVDAAERYGKAYSFHLFAPATTVRLCSRAASPQELGLARDPRRLGVAVTRVIAWQGESRRIIAAQDPVLARGFHPYEHLAAYRWTDGDALLPRALFEGWESPVELVVNLTGRTFYPLPEEPAAAAA